MASISQNDACPSFVYELASDEYIHSVLIKIPHVTLSVEPPHRGTLETYCAVHVACFVHSMFIFLSTRKILFSIWSCCWLFRRMGMVLESRQLV